MKHIEDIKQYVDHNCIVCLYETWSISEPAADVGKLKSYEQQTFFAPAEKDAAKCRPKCGIEMFVDKKMYKCEIVFNNENCLIIKCKVGSLKIIQVTIYISPIIEIEQVLGDLSEQSDIIMQEFPDMPLILGGDFNARIANENKIV